MRRILIDSHVLLWWLNDDAQLGEQSDELITDQSNEVFVSAASTWEIAIKRNKGMLEAPEDIESIIDELGFIKLAISVFHGEQAAALPEHHKDPFDRMLIAQAQAEGLELMSCDARFPAYGVKLLDPRK